MNPLTILSMVALSMLLVGCNPLKSTETAEKEVPVFHGRFDAKDFETIYNTAHPDFKASDSKEEIIKFISNVREKMGTVKSTSKTGVQTNSINLEASVILTYATEYENGKGTENFTYRVDDDKAQLISWRVNSNDLITAPSADPTPEP